MDMQTNDLIAEGLSMPHSPRMHDGKLWLLNSSGTGYLGFIDATIGKFEPVAFVPGYTQGDYQCTEATPLSAIEATARACVSSLPLDTNLSDRGAAPWCGLQVIDLKTEPSFIGLRIESTIEELFEIAVLPGVLKAENPQPFIVQLTGHQLSFIHRGQQQRWTSAPRLDHTNKINGDRMWPRS